MIQPHPSLKSPTFSLAKSYDSHVHFLETGEISALPNLRKVRRPQEISQIHFPKETQRGRWIYGFGWDENQWNGELPHRIILDDMFPAQPTILSRCDGHSSWVNTQALIELGWLHQKNSNFFATDKLNHKDPQKIFLPRDSQGIPIGILKEWAHVEALLCLPKWESSQKQNFLKKAVQIFNTAGFTHVRDMTSSADLFQQLKVLENSRDLTLSLDLNFVCENTKDFQRAFAELKECKSESSNLVHPRGIKVFLDGSLGSQTALLTKPYADNTHGVLLWDLDELEDCMRRCFVENLEFSVHTIGDEASFLVAQRAQKLSKEGIVGRLNLEHVQVLKKETIQIFKSIHVRCHMQPCHWLSDRGWLNEKLGSLASSAFQWEALRAAKVPLQFGSDSPIENPSLFDNLRALHMSAKAGIPPFREEWFRFHECPYADTVTSRTDFENGKVVRINFAGHDIM